MDTQRLPRHSMRLPQTTPAHHHPQMENPSQTAQRMGSHRHQHSQHHHVHGRPVHQIRPTQNLPHPQSLRSQTAAHPKTSQNQAQNSPKTHGKIQAQRTQQNHRPPPQANHQHRQTTSNQTIRTHHGKPQRNPPKQTTNIPTMKQPPFRCGEPGGPQRGSKNPKQERVNAPKAKSQPPGPDDGITLGASQLKRN